MGDAGRIAPLPKGSYNANTSYEFLDIVKYNNNIFMAKQNSTGHTPVGDSNDAYWMLLINGFVVDSELSLTSENPVQNKVVKAAFDNLPEPMVFKGSLGTGGTITTLPTASSSNEGYTYKVITAGTYASQSAKVGDTFISDGSSWVLIPSGDEPSGTVTSVGFTEGTGINIDGTNPIISSGTVIISHEDTSSQETVTNTGRTYIQSISLDDMGHVTSLSSATETVVAPSATITTPKMDGTAAVGSETTWAKGDHVHPSDTSKVSTSTKVNGHALSSDVTVTKSDVGLSNVVNTGDSDTPVSGGNTKFTTGGAYTELNKKVDKVDGKGLSTNDYTTDEKNKLSGIASGAEVNQNAFSSIDVIQGSTTTNIAADSKTDKLTFVAGTNVTLTPDATNDKVTIAATDTIYSFEGAANGIKVTSGSSSNTYELSSIAASKITGTISVDNLPASALERVVVVADDTARFALTTSTVQLGDTVKVTATKKMYMVKDTSKLNQEAGYEEYVTSTDWSVITNKPNTYTPSSHTHGNIQNDGILQTTDVVIANGDKLVITDSSDSDKIARASITFDGSTTTQALTKKGTFETFLNNDNNLVHKTGDETIAGTKTFSGNVIANTFEATGADYAEKFMNPENIGYGYFVSLDGEYLKLAQPNDYILGITSNMTSMVGDKELNGIEVGLLGKLWVEQDGTAKVNDYVTTRENGIATKSDSGYRVMKTDGNKILVLFR